MRALSVDLASANYRDVGIVLLDGVSGVKGIVLRLEELGLVGRPNVNELAQFLCEFAANAGAEIIAIDGPQGWKDPDNGHSHCRVAEALLHTQGKTGLPGTCKPGNYVGFISFSVDLFNALAEQGWPRLTAPGERRIAAETFPTSAWRALKLPALPGKGGTTADQLLAHTHLLSDRFGIEFDREPSHDELQAAVSGIGALAFLRGRSGFELVGLPPRQIDRTWREGFILNPSPDVFPSIG